MVKKSYESYTDFMCVFYVFFHLNVVIGKVELKKGSMKTQVLEDQKEKIGETCFFPCSNWMLIYLQENPIIASLEKIKDD